MIECSICMSQINQEIELTCQHIFCRLCIYKWAVKYNASCPMCRCKITTPIRLNNNVIAFNVFLDEIGLVLYNNMSGDNQWIPCYNVDL